MLRNKPVEKVNRLSGIVAVACLVWLPFLTGCGGGSGGSGSSGSNPSPPPLNPTPSIVSLSPNAANAGGTDFTLTVTGADFMSSSLVRWNGSPRSTAFSSSTQLQAQISAADIASSGSTTVSVTNQPPGGGNSGLAQFIISAASNPLPSLTFAAPGSANTGSSGFIL